VRQSVVWKRWVRDMRTLQRRCARDGYRMLVSLKLEPATRRKRKKALASATAQPYSTANQEK
jgi:hypothetical protein